MAHLERSDWMNQYHWSEAERLIIMRAGIFNTTQGPPVPPPRRVTWKPVAIIHCENCHLLTPEFQLLNCLEAVDPNPGHGWLFATCAVCESLHTIHIDRELGLVELDGAFFVLDDGTLVWEVDLPSAPRGTKRPRDDQMGHIRNRDGTASAYPVGPLHQQEANRQGSSVATCSMRGPATASLAMRRVLHF